MPRKFWMWLEGIDNILLCLQVMLMNEGILTYGRWWISVDLGRLIDFMMDATMAIKLEEGYTNGLSLVSRLVLA